MKVNVRLQFWFQLRLSAVLIFLFIAIPTLQAQPKGILQIPLSQGWEFRQNPDGASPADTPWRPAQVPGDVHLDLLRNQLIPDPFYRDNEAKLQWIENASWEYHTTFQASPELMGRRHVDLVFEGLDAAAEVYLNNKLILTADNMFRIWRVDIKAFLVPGANQLHVVFPSPIQAAQKVAASDHWRSLTHTAEKTYVRKAAYEYGWDWGPRFVTSGIWRPVQIEAWDDARIPNFHIRQLDVSTSVAHLIAEVEITASGDSSALVTVNYSQAGKKIEIKRQADLHDGVNHVDFPVDIAKPNLWYPNGYGTPAMYDFVAAVKTGKDGAVQSHVRTGLRSVVLRRDVDAWGRSFEFVVNGIPVFAKGADVIPFDSFPSRVTTDQYRRILQSARDSNMNMIRHWGGGYYETDEFYAMCDELGIMVWQDFMFGNDWQPGTYAWKENVAQEAEDQLRRLRDHPSIVLWSGNNETEESFAWNRNKADASAQLQMWQDYLTVFSGILPAAVERWTPEIPYWPSSPSSDYEEVSPAYESGDGHDWSVWHGESTFAEYESHYFRFVSEYGFQSFPELKTIEAFTLPQDRANIFTPVMLAHQKSADGNSIIQGYLLRDYSQPKDFASFLYVSQVLQAEGIKIGAEHMRRNRPRIMGSLYWQLNDCWPVASWSSIDYFGRWKALQYYARRFYSPLLISPHVENGGLAVYVVSDEVQPLHGDIRLRLEKFDGEVVSEKSGSVEISPLTSKSYLQIPMVALTGSRDVDPATVFVAADLTVDGQMVSHNLIYLVPTRQIQLPQARIAATLTKNGDGYRLTLSSTLLARDVYVTFGDLDAQVSDNYFDLLPGEPTAITITSRAKLEALQQQMKVISLVDAFAPAQMKTVGTMPK